MTARLSLVHKLILVAAVALAVRLPGLWWGLPGPTHLFSYHPDEYHSLRGAFSLSQGDLNPHFFNYGCFYLYAVAAAAEIVAPRLFARLCAAWAGPQPEALVALLPQALRTWTLAGRLVSLAASVGTVVAVAAAAEVAGLSGLWAGLVLAVMPLHALTARYATVDPTLTFWVAAVVLLTALSERDGRRRWFVAAGAAAGLAASTKYTGALALLMPLLVCLAPDAKTPRRQRLVTAAATVASAAAAFVLTSPYVVLAWPEAARDIAFEMQHMRVGEYPARAAEPCGLWFHLKWTTLGTAGLALPGFVGLAAAVARRRDRSTVPATMMAAAATAFLWLAVISSAHVRYARYELPLLPLLALGAAHLVGGSRGRGQTVRGDRRVVRGTTEGRRGTWQGPFEALKGALGTLMVLGLAHCLLICAITCRPDTRDQALKFLLANSAPDEAVGLIWEPWFQSPPVDYCNGGAVLRHHPLWGQFSRELRPIVVVGYEAERLRERAPRWLAISEVELRDYLRAGDQKGEKLAAEVHERYRLVRFWGRRFGAVLWPLWLAPPHDWLYPAMPIRLYRRVEAAR